MADVSAVKGGAGAAKAIDGDQSRWEQNSLIVLAALIGVLIVCYGNSLYETYRIWSMPSGKYSHGYIVPVFALLLFYLRYEPIRMDRTTAVSRWAGVGLLSFGLALRLLFTYSPHSVPEMYTFLISLAGVVLLVGGWNALRWTWPIVLFLIFMYPLPGQADRYLLAPLQSVATRGSTFCLQTLGVASYNEGNRIFVNFYPIDVEEQCSGLRMVTVFLAFSVLLTLITDRPIWERCVLIASTFPIALIVNIARITITGLLYLLAEKGYLSHKMVHDLFHMMAGWFMMPMAFGLMYLEMQVLMHMFVEEDTTPMSVGMHMRSPGSPV